jgi:hypothetical protein
MDNIDRIMKEADAKGFGVSYGKYQAACFHGAAVPVSALQEPIPKGEQPVLCRYCGKPFKRSHKNKVYCGEECKDKAKIKRQNAWRKKKRRSRPPEVASCVICGADFKTKRCTDRYCSKECAREGGKINAARWRAEQKKGDA